MIAITSNWKNNYAPQNVTGTRTHRFGLQDNVRWALSQTYPCIDKLLKNKQYQNSHWNWFNENLHTFVKVHKHVRSYRRDLVSPYGLDATSRVARMFVFCKLDHHGTKFGISLFWFHLMHTKAIDPQKKLCGPRLGTIAVKCFWAITTKIIRHAGRFNSSATAVNNVL